MPVPLRCRLASFLLIGAAAWCGMAWAPMETQVFAADGGYNVVLMANGEGGRALIPAVIDALLKADGQSAFTPPEG
jgi:hypothetical protein